MTGSVIDKNIVSKAIRSLLLFIPLISHFFEFSLNINTCPDILERAILLTGPVGILSREAQGAEVVR